MSPNVLHSGLYESVYGGLYNLLFCSLQWGQLWSPRQVLAWGPVGVVMGSAEGPLVESNVAFYCGV
eukprot:5368042-Lingulodinium_polyedra.AAC.1